ncbi:hypothetical protein PPBDW_II0963 [Photobacterium kishitanii]|nr:hypothetical protein PPBDW_II0963 [Photobacterium kishitanii]
MTDEPVFERLTPYCYQILDVKKPAIACGLFYLAPSTGLEPVTYGLTVR